MEKSCKKRNSQGTLSDYVKDMEVCSGMMFCYIQEVMEIARMCGMKGLEDYMEYSMAEMEKSIMWMRAARSYLESV